ncbi:hypothetical protein SLY_0755 [Strawberry lethal yellows phytoplasma (CPA) str. NZSb11]|uniref:Uncharacterized protein n=1 Tax=Strawberry lethal yellows phytoplasma (CPA) str. NZSb11 TaxID=980422 RepID=R4RQ89_PHYAS|nr:hypothetical protein SLY_0755 [Strawberry lethal yellows phytoplasma (CPA) str. NZSb11]
MKNIFHQTKATKKGITCKTKTNAIEMMQKIVLNEFFMIKFNYKKKFSVCYFLLGGFVIVKKIFFKRNYLIILMLVCFLLCERFVPFAFAAENDENTHEVVRTITESKDLLNDIKDSLANKTVLATSKVVNEIQVDLRKNYPDNKRTVTVWLNLLIDDILNVSRWSDVEVDHFKKHLYDGVWMKQVLKDTLQNIFETAKVEIVKQQDPSCKFITEHLTKALLKDLIESVVIFLWNN